MSTRLFGCSVVGPLHVQLALPCQDAFAFLRLPSGGCVIAVADGLGSASRSDVGARLAVDTAVSCSGLALGACETEVVPLGAVMQAAVQSAREALEARSEAEQCELHDLACTMIAVVFLPDRVAVAHVGDGAVVAQGADGLLLISGPGDSEYANEVASLASAGWEDFVRVAVTESSVECLAVFTDGLQRAAFRKLEGGIEPFEGFFAPIFTFVRQVQDAAEGEAEVRELLASSKVCANSEDDKTLVLAVVDRD